jgi:Flp pilus assembly protein TadG
MMSFDSREGRHRRGVEAIEFAMILPLFFVIIFSVVEFSWYMFQRSLVVDAARRGCHAAAQLDPKTTDFADAVSVRVESVLETSNLDCADRVCAVEIEDRSGLIPPRIYCEVTVDYRTITGFFGQSGDTGKAGGLKLGSYRWRGLGLIPDELRGRSSAVFEGL